MKNTFRIFGIIALTAVIGFAFAACGDPDSGNSTSKTYSGDGYTLTIKENPNNPNRAFTPLAGDFYELKKGKTSKGIVNEITGDTFSLMPEGASTPFTVMVSGGTISGVAGVIVWEDGSTETPITVGTTSGKLTITGLGSYNGKYVFANGGDEDGKHLLAASAITNAHDFTGAQISGASVELKVWEFTESYQLSNYSSGAVMAAFFDVLIANKATVSNDEVSGFFEALELGGSLPSWFVALGIVEPIFYSGIGSGAFEPDM